MPDAPARRSFYSASTSEFLITSQDAVFGALSSNYDFALEGPQKEAWRFQIEHLRQVLPGLPAGHLFLEFEIPRIGRRADVILLINGVLFVLEYKLGARYHDRAAIDQVIDYALDLKNFHAGSRSISIVPVLVSTKAPDQTWTIQIDNDGITSVALANTQTLGCLVTQGLARLAPQTIDPIAWDTDHRRSGASTVSRSPRVLDLPI